MVNLVVAMCFEIKGWFSFGVFVIYVLLVYMLISLLAHPICLCLVMIVYAVYVSK